jgi:hypothetical protein
MNATSAQNRLLYFAYYSVSPGLELTYPSPSLHLINFFGREGNINLT